MNEQMPALLGIAAPAAIREMLEEDCGNDSGRYSQDRIAHAGNDPQVLCGRSPSSPAKFPSRFGRGDLWHVVLRLRHLAGDVLRRGSAGDRRHHRWRLDPSYLRDQLLSLRTRCQTVW